jgi:uncharacterized protein YdaU (DUF1376 family)
MAPMNGLPYYKRFPRDFFEGTIGMPFEIKSAYGLVLDLIYMQGGALPDDAGYIAGLLGCSVRKWHSLRAELIARGKISADLGIISNSRARAELLTLRTYQDKQSENGRKANKSNSLQKPSLQPKPSHTEPDTERGETKVSLPRKRGNPKTRLSPDALIPEQMRAAATERGLSDAEAEAQFAKFRDWAVAKGQAYADWGAAWRNWLSSPYYAPVLGAVLPLKPEKADGRPSRSDQRLDAMLRGAAG